MGDGLGSGRVISGRRRDLSRVREPAAIRRLGLVGTGIESIAGIEQMQALEELQLERFRAPALDRLTALPNLRTLLLEALIGDVDYEAIARLRELRRLWLFSIPPAAAPAVTRIDFAKLRKLTDLELSPEQTGVRFPLDWFPLPNLAVLDLGEFTLSDTDLDRVIAAPAALRRLGFAPTSELQADRALQGLEPAVTVALHGVGMAPLDSILEHTDDEGHVSFSVALDLSDATSTESNIDGELMLRDAIERQAPEIASRLRYDTESSAVWVTADRREDLERVRELASRLSQGPR
jgi:hypothetical protein